jgi:UDPglucose--hexose-1-phosphate uridylyltransferase
LKQEERQGKRIVDTQGEYVALCPYASRVPYEIWVLHRKHNHMFEQPRPGANRRHLAALLRRMLRRVRQIAPAYHLVVHTSPNIIHPKSRTLNHFLTTIENKYH